MTKLADRRILVTGPAGQIAFPMAEALARDNEVWGIARFGDPSTRERCEAAGITTRVCESSAPKGSSISSTCGLVASARTMPTRCFMPPES